MAILLSDLKVGMNDKVAENVVDLFIRHSEVLEMLPFDDAVAPGGGSTMTYGYIQNKLPGVTAFRAINSEYVASEATVEKKSVDLKVFGGAFNIDRVIKGAEGMYNNMAHQIEEKVKSAVGTFHNAMINGDSTQNQNEFDGLDKFLVGQTTEYNTGSYIDLSTMALLKQNADDFYEKLTNLVNSTDANAVMVNAGMKTKIQTVARVLGYKTESEEAFGRKITKIDEIRIIDLGNIASVVTDFGTGTKSAVEEAIIKANHGREVGTALGTYTKTSDTAINPNKTYYTRSGSEGAYTYTKVTTPVVDNIGSYYEQDGVYVTGLTDIYAVKFDVNNGFHGVTVTGDNVIKKYLPNFELPGAVKSGEVEMIAAVALKNVKHAGVLRNIKI